MCEHTRYSADDQGAAGPGERRNSPRHPWGRGALCGFPFALAGDQPTWEARVRDISTQGLGLLSDRCISPGALLEVEMHNPTGDSWAFRLVRVQHSTVQADGLWLLGCVFIRPFNAEELQALLS